MGTCKTTLERWVKQGQFPPPLNVGAGGVRLWAVADIEAVLNGTWTPSAAADGGATGPLKAPATAAG
jgi:predicted DNA-binding transcriptional regulator AlpA